MTTLLSIQPIETAYRGYRFRSRLEARWAVFFDAAGIEWEYEAEGFDLDGDYYLPDFWLPSDRVFLEIKPRIGGYEQRHTLIKQVSPVLTKLADLSDREVFLVVGSPNPDRFIDKGDGIIGASPEILGFAPHKGICSSRLFECPVCGRVSIRRFIGSAWDAVCPCRPGLVFDDDNYNPYEWPDRVRRAMEKARSARFEHRETPRP